MNIKTRLTQVLAWTIYILLIPILVPYYLFLAKPVRRWKMNRYMKKFYGRPLTSLEKEMLRLDLV